MHAWLVCNPGQKRKHRWICFIYLFSHFLLLNIDPIRNIQTRKVVTTLISSKHLHMLSHTDGATLEALHKVAKGKVCLTQGHFETNTTGVSDCTSDLPITGFWRVSPLNHSYPGCSLHRHIKMSTFILFYKCLFTLHRTKSIKWQLAPIGFQVQIIVKLDEDFFRLHGQSQGSIWEHFHINTSTPQVRLHTFLYAETWPHAKKTWHCPILRGFKWLEPRSFPPYAS